MIESGIIFNIWLKAQTKVPEDCLGSGVDPLGADNLLGIFLIIIIGLATSVIICLTEKLISSSIKKQFY